MKKYNVTRCEGEGPPTQRSCSAAPGPHTASMAGDSETRLQDQDENTTTVRQPFLIGVSGGTASGKVSARLLTSQCEPLTVGFIECSFDVKSRATAGFPRTAWLAHSGAPA